MAKAVLFDFDGVLVKSEPLHMKTFLDLLSPYGVRVTEERWYREFAGTGSRRIFQTLTREYGIEENVDELVNKRKEMFIRYAREGRISEMPGLIDFLNFLKEKRIRMVIVSGGHRKYIEVLLDILGIENSFEFMVTADDIPERKPNPEPFLYASRKLGLRPDQCLVLEDSYSGCEAGKAAGMKVVWVKPHDSMEPPECDFIIEDLQDGGLKRLVEG